jgi:hypothetical protein
MEHRGPSHGLRLGNIRVDSKSSGFVCRDFQGFGFVDPSSSEAAKSRFSSVKMGADFTPLIGFGVQRLR